MHVFGTLSPSELRQQATARKDKSEPKKSSNSLAHAFRETKSPW